MPKHPFARHSPVHLPFNSSAQTTTDGSQSSQAPSLALSLLHERATPFNHDIRAPQNTVHFTASKNNLCRISSAVGLILQDINRVYPCLAKVPHYLSIKKYFKDNVRDRVRLVVTNETLATTTQVYNLYRNSYDIKSDLQQLFEICRTRFAEYTMPPIVSPGQDANLSGEDDSELSLERSTRTVGRIMSAAIKIVAETKKQGEIKLSNLQYMMAILEIRDRFYQILKGGPVPKSRRQLLTFYYEHYDLLANVQLLRYVSSQTQTNDTAQETEKEIQSQINNLTVQNMTLSDTVPSPYAHKTTELKPQQNESMPHCSRDQITSTVQVNNNLSNNVTHEMELNEESTHQHAQMSTPTMRQCEKGQISFEKPSENLFSGPESISNTITMRINSVIDKIVKDMINDHPETHDSHDYIRFIVRNRINKIIMNKPVPNYRELLILYREYHDSESDSQLIDFYANTIPSSLHLPSLQPHSEVGSTVLNSQSGAGCSVTQIEQVTFCVACQSSASDKYSVHRLNTTSQTQPTSIKTEGTTFNGPESASYTTLNHIMKATLKIVHSMNSISTGLPDLQLMYLRGTVRDRIYKIITGKPLPKYRELFTLYRAHYDYGSDEQLIRDIFTRKQDCFEPPNWPVASEVEEIDAVQSKILEELRDKYPELVEFNNVMLRWIVRDRLYKLFKDKPLPVQNMIHEIYRKHYGVLSDERLLRDILRGKDINTLKTEIYTTLKTWAQTDQEGQYCQIMKKVHEILDKKLDPIFNKLFQMIKSNEGIVSTDNMQDSSSELQHLHDATITKNPFSSQVTPANEKLPQLQSTNITQDIHIIYPERENVLQQIGSGQSQDVGIISLADSNVNFNKTVKEKQKNLTENADPRKHLIPTTFAMSERQRVVGDSTLDERTEIKETTEKLIDSSKDIICSLCTMTNAYVDGRAEEAAMTKESATDSNHIKPMKNATNSKEENLSQMTTTDKASDNYATMIKACNSNSDSTCDAQRKSITEMSVLRYSEGNTMIEECTTNLKKLYQLKNAHTTGELLSQNSIAIKSESQQSKPPELAPVTDKTAIKHMSNHQHVCLADSDDKPREKTVDSTSDESTEDAALERIVHRIMQERLKTILPSIKNKFASLVAEDEELLTSFGLKSSEKVQMQNIKDDNTVCIALATKD